MMGLGGHQLKMPIRGAFVGCASMARGAVHNATAMRQVIADPTRVRVLRRIREPSDGPCGSRSRDNCHGRVSTSFGYRGTTLICPTLAFTCGGASKREPRRQVECVVGRPSVTQLRGPPLPTAKAGW